MMRRPALLTLAAAAALALTGCGWLEDRFQTCEHMQIDLQNSDQSIGPVTILADSEVDLGQGELTSGMSRRIVQCVERGDSKRFRALRGIETLAVANCVVTRTRGQYDAVVARVVWDPRGLVCENW